MKVKDARYWDGRALSFVCPGCGDSHLVTVKPNPEKPGERPVWGWNGSYDAPTFTPSLLVTSGHYVSGESPDTCWQCQHPDCGFTCYRCHSFVTDGRIQFLSDCTHALAGQTVDLPEIEIERTAQP
jgi:predicted RNA-binding Zn-ribbon protein involved in translation (DUF1610 family)